MIRRVRESLSHAPWWANRAATAASVAVLSALLGACSTTAPPKAELGVPLSDEFRESGATGPATASVKWWQAFGDEQLSGLIEQALERNQNLQIALQRVNAARFGVTAQSAALLPSLDGQAGAQKSSSGLPAPVKTAWQPDVRAYQAGLQLSWELDLSGALRAARDAAKSDLVAAQAGVVGVRLEVASEVARQYFIFRRAEKRLAVLGKLAESKRQSAKLVANRVEQGLFSQVELELALADADVAEAQLPALRSLCTSAQASTASLLGMNPSQRPIASVTEYVWPKVVPIGAGQPSDLLRRRPDLLAAEAKYSAQTLRAVQARDQMWPRLFLGALIGRENLRLNSLSFAPTYFENVAMSFAVPLFNSGRISAIADGEDAVAKQTLLEWQHAVLIAVQEVESSLAVKHNEDAKSLIVGDELARRQGAFRRVQSLFREGQASRLTVLEVQRSVLSSELDAVDGAEERVLSYVQLYKALGGGWFSRPQDGDKIATDSMNTDVQKNLK